MFKRFSLIVFLLILSVGVFAQKSIQSTVFDSNNGMPLEMVTVRLLRGTDSTLVQGAQTNSNGWFSLPKIKPGKYILVVSSVGYNDHKENITIGNRDVILKNIQLIENVLALKELEVRGTAAQMVVKGDTLEYNATAFKTQENAVVEDLLKKLPGLEITAEGKITVNGEEIKKIRVDGKKFFDGDLEMATKNLPAEMIEKIQVLEQKSEMAQLTGFEDENTERIINLTTKSSRRKGVFGNIMGGAGYDNEDLLRYDGNANINFMNGDAQTSIVAGVNNINTSRSGRGRGSWGANNGITETQNLGLNNNAIINDKFKIGGDASFNHSDNLSETNRTKESYLRESVFNDSTYTLENAESYEANLRLEAEWKPDSLTTLIFQPHVNYNFGNSSSFKDYVYLQDLDTTSYGNARTADDNTSLSAGLRLIYSRKFPSKIGRTLTANVNTGISQSETNTYNFSNKYSTQITGINQYTNHSSNRLSFGARVSFVEPLWNYKNMLETVLDFNTNTQSSKKDQWATTDPTAFYNRNPEDYTTFVDEYSNNFSSRFFKETVELNYRYTEKEFNLTLGLKGEPSQTISKTIYGNGDDRNVTNKVFNFAPNGRFQYNFGKKKFMRLDYRGITDQPSIRDMQPVKNNANQMQETVGNPTLNPAFSNYFRMMYSTFNDKTFSSFNTWVSLRFVKDQLVSNRIYDSTGKQYIQTVNSGETPLNLNANVMFNTPIIQKRLHFNTSTSGGYETDYGYTAKGVNPELIDPSAFTLGDLSSTREYTGNQMLSLTFTHDVVEIGVRGNIRYSNSFNNLSNKTIETYQWSGRGNVVIRLPYDITLNSDIAYSDRWGFSNFDQSEVLWNASIDKSLFKNKGVLSLRWVDMLQQQLNIRQTVGDNSMTFTKYNTLTSYFILSFSYKIRQFGGSRGNMDDRMRDVRLGPPGVRPEGGSERNSERSGGGIHPDGYRSVRPMGM